VRPQSAGSPPRHSAQQRDFRGHLSAMTKTQRSGAGSDDREPDAGIADGLDDGRAGRSSPLARRLDLATAGRPDAPPDEDLELGDKRQGRSGHRSRRPLVLPTRSRSESATPAGPRSVSAHSTPTRPDLPACPRRCAARSEPCVAQLRGHRCAPGRRPTLPGDPRRISAIKAGVTSARGTARIVRPGGQALGAGRFDTTAVHGDSWPRTRACIEISNSTCRRGRAAATIEQVSDNIESCSR